MTTVKLAQHLITGKAAEEVAETFLQQKGLKLVERNFRCPYGEIDLIMRDGETLVFVEVRFRRNNHFGGAAMSITPSKQQKLSCSAEHYLQIHGSTACRFDVVLMQATEQNAVEWIQNAF